ncbi:MAG: hypothetical protein ABJG47_18580 [Ekhidna sp.]
MSRVFRILTFFLLVVSGCTNAVRQPDYSKSTAKPIELLLDIVQGGLSSKLEVQIINRHNGVYQLNSIIENSNETVRVSTHINDMNSKESDTTFNFSKNKFVEKLNQELKASDAQMTFAGNFQQIRIKTDAETSEFYTQKAFGLMALLRGDK